MFENILLNIKIKLLEICNIFLSIYRKIEPSNYTIQDIIDECNAIIQNADHEEQGLVWTAESLLEHIEEMGYKTH